MSYFHKIATIALTALLLHGGIAGAQNLDAKRQQLLELKELFEQGLITKEIYNQRQQEIIGRQVLQSQHSGSGTVTSKKNLMFKTDGLPSIDFEPLNRYVDVESSVRTDRPPGGMMMCDCIVILYKGRGILMIPPPFIAAYDGDGVRTATDRIYIDGKTEEGVTSRAIIRLSTPQFYRAARIVVEGGPAPKVAPRSSAPLDNQEPQPPAAASVPSAARVPPPVPQVKNDDMRRLMCEDAKRERDRNCNTIGNSYTTSEVERAVLELRRENCRLEAAKVRCD